MSTDQKVIEIRGIPIYVLRKNIKHLYVRICPPDGLVRVSSPLRLSDDAVRLAVISRLDWIRKQQAKLAQQPRQSKREMLSGESHYFQGRRYRLDVIEKEGTPFVRLINNTTMQLCVRPGTDRAKREAILHQWYRDRLTEQFPGLLAKWQPKMGVTVSEVRVRKMKTLWGSCNVQARRIWLNLELAKKPPQCLEYVFVHEMVHLLERYHNERFFRFMDRFMPNWRIYRDELNRAPLAYEIWS